MGTTFQALIKQFLPILLKWLLPLLGIGVVSYQGTLAANGDASTAATVGVSAGSLLTVIASIISGMKLQGSDALKDFSAAAIDKALTFIDAAVDKAADYLKDVIRQRLLQILQRLFTDGGGTTDAEAVAAFNMLGNAHARLVTSQPVLTKFAPVVVETTARTVPAPAPVPAPVVPAPVVPAPVPKPAG